MAIANKYRVCHRFSSGLLFIALVLQACSNREETADHAGYLAKVFTVSDSMNTTDYQQALHIIDSCCQAIPNPGIRDLYKKYDRKSSIYLFHHNYPEANVYADSMLWVIRNHTGDTSYLTEYAKAMHTKCRVLERIGKYSEALDYTFRARRQLEQMHNVCWQSEFTCIIGIIKYKQGLYKDACRFGILSYNEALTCDEDRGKYVSLQGKLDDIGIYYTRAGMADSGLYYFNKALDILKEAAQKRTAASSQKFFRIATAVVYGNMGDAYYQEGDTQKTEQLYLQSIAVDAAQGYDRYDAELTFAKLAKLYLEKKDPARARVTLKKFKALLDSVPNRETELKWYSLQMQYYALAGHKDSAYDYLQPYLQLKDSLINIQHPALSVDNELERIKNRYELSFLENQYKVKNAYLAVTVVICLLAILALSLLWLYWYRLRKMNRRIISQNEQMQLAIGSLEESQKENTRMMKIVAHDLRNPMTSVISITAMLLESSSLQPEDRQMLELMKTSGENSIDMIADLLNVNTTSENLKKEQTDLQQLLRYCADMLQFKAAEKNQQLVLDLEHISVRANKDKLWRVFSNLITNAIKFSPQHSVIYISMHRQEPHVKITVQDHGIGIPADMQPRIFDMFTDAKRTGTEGEATFGLGLAIARQIIEAHGGTISVSSIEGKGSTFTIILPFA